MTQAELSRSETLQVVKYTADQEDLCLDFQMLLDVLGYGKDLDPSMEDTIRAVFNENKQLIRPVYGYRLIDEGVKIEGEKITCGGITFECGNTITRYFKGVQGVALFTATIGSGFVDTMKSCFDGGDPFTGYILDTMGSLAAEQCAELAGNTITGDVSRDGSSTTNRYSPGYCNWNVKEQKKLFSLLPKNFCGINLTQSSLMLPIKSVSGIIGIGSQVVKQPYQCEICTSRNCTYKKVLNKHGH